MNALATGIAQRIKVVRQSDLETMSLEEIRQLANDLIGFQQAVNKQTAKLERLNFNAKQQGFLV